MIRAVLVAAVLALAMASDCSDKTEPWYEKRLSPEEAKFMTKAWCDADTHKVYHGCMVGVMKFLIHHHVPVKHAGPLSDAYCSCNMECQDVANGLPTKIDGLNDGKCKMGYILGNKDNIAKLCPRINKFYFAERLLRLYDLPDALDIERIVEEGPKKPMSIAMVTAVAMVSMSALAVMLVAGRRMWRSQRPSANHQVDAEALNVELQGESVE